MDTNTISYYNWLYYNKTNKVISKRINFIFMHKSDSFKNLAVRPTLNNIPVLPASLSHSIEFQYKSCYSWGNTQESGKISQPEDKSNSDFKV